VRVVHPTTEPDADVYHRLLVDAVAELLWTQEQRAGRGPERRWRDLGGYEQELYRDRARERVRVLAREDAEPAG
jgi:hypothetical protein